MATVLATRAGRGSAPTRKNRQQNADTMTLSYLNQPRVPSSPKAHQETPMLTRQVGVAATCLGLIARAGEGGLQIPQIAERTGISKPTLAKVIYALARKKLVKTRRGVGGGVALARPASSITMYGLCVLLDDPVVECRCMFGFGHCAADGACPPGCPCMAMHHKQIEFLKGTTMADVSSLMLSHLCHDGETRGSTPKGRSARARRTKK